MAIAHVGSWRPLSQRDEPLTDESLFDGVPDHLEGPLAAWLIEYLSLGRPFDLAQRVALRLRFPTYPVPGQTARNTIPNLVSDFRHYGLLLDAVDASLQFDDDLRSGVSRLEEVLTDAGSAYAVDEENRCLVRRVDATVAAAAQKATGAKQEPGKHLQAAWLAVYGLHPDPSTGYAEAVRAVEAAAIPVVLPKGTQETLGKVRAHLRDASAQWELAIEGKSGKAVDPLVGMLTLLWEGQQRHAGGPGSRPQRQDEAEMAVHLAATLVHWFTSGMIRKRP